MENIKDMVATLRVETKRVAVRFTDWLDVTVRSHPSDF